MTKHIPPYSPEVRARAVRPARCGWCSTTKASTPRKRLRSARWPPRSAARRRRCAAGFARPSATTAGQERIRALERENRELRQANEILRKASAYFAQAELDRRSKP